MRASTPTEEEGRADPGHSLRSREPLFAHHQGVVFLGLIHRDENGPALLDRCLDLIAPEVISLEFSRYGMEFRKERGPGYARLIRETFGRLQKSGLPCYDNALSATLSYVEMPYEYQRASLYGRDHGVPVRLVDMDYFSYVKLREIERFLSPENLERILQEDSGRGGGDELLLARLFFEEGVRTAAYTEEMLVRDGYMSRKIAVLRRYYGGRRFLHITGWRHLEDPYNVYGFLKPLKVFIYDKALCI